MRSLPQKEISERIKTVSIERMGKWGQRPFNCWYSGKFSKFQQPLQPTPGRQRSGIIRQWPGAADLHVRPLQQWRLPVAHHSETPLLRVCVLGAVAAFRAHGSCRVSGTRSPCATAASCSVPPSRSPIGQHSITACANARSESRSASTHARVSRSTCVVVASVRHAIGYIPRRSSAIASSAAAIAS